MSGLNIMGDSFLPDLLRQAYVLLHAWATHQCVFSGTCARTLPPDPRTNRYQW